MNLRHFENKARQSYWVVHVEAWRRSGLTRTEYCRVHRLTKDTLDRWLKYFAGNDAARKQSEYQADLRRQRRLEERAKRQKKRARLRFAVSTDVRNRAVQAYWAMHVEAMNWSGMGHAEYAAALGLSRHALRIWRDRLEESSDEMDWRSLLHPSARAQLSSAANCARRQYRLTPEAMDGRSNRRRFSDEQKRAIVQETEKPGVAVAQVCRRHGIATSMAFRWREEFGLTARKAPQLALVELAEGAEGGPPALAALRDLVRPPDGMVAIDLDDGLRVFAPAGTTSAAVKRHLAGKEKAS